MSYSVKLTRGFTLIELLLVIAIILIIGTFSAVFFSRFLNQNAVLNTQDQLVAELRKAQLYSMMGKQNSGWGVRFGSNKITLFQGNTYITRNTAFDENFTINATISITGFTEIDFAKVTGIPNTSGTYTIVGNGSSKQITVTAVGVVNR